MSVEDIKATQARNAGRMTATATVPFAYGMYHLQLPDGSARITDRLGKTRGRAAQAVERSFSGIYNIAIADPDRYWLLILNQLLNPDCGVGAAQTITPQVIQAHHQILEDHIGSLGSTQIANYIRAGQAALQQRF